MGCAILAPDAAAIAKVTLVRAMAVTHQADSEQRVIQIAFTQSGANTLTAIAADGWHPQVPAPRGQNASRAEHCKPRRKGEPK